MPKNLSDILKGVNKSQNKPLTTGDNPGVDYADKMKDTRDFVAQHSVEKHEDRVGNGDDVYAGAKVKKAKMERHGHEPKPKDIQVYNKNQQVGQPENKLKEEADLDEGKDPREYGYEGDMAITQLKTICRHAEHLMKMLKPDTDLPEWVQSKITKAEDYISTAHDYLMSEMNEEIEKLDERVKQNKIKKNAAIEKIGANARKANDPMHLDVIGTGIRQDVADKIRGRELSSGKNRREVKEEDEFTESKCNMTEAGKMCEVHGMKACPKEEDESSQNKEPRYTGKKEKPGRKLLTDKKSIEEMATSQNQAIAARIALKHKKEGTMPPKGTASYSMMNMSTKQLHDYTHAEKGAPKKIDESNFEKSLTKTQRARLNAALIKSDPKNPVNVEKKKREAAKEKSDWYNSFKKPTSEEVSQTDTKHKGLPKKVEESISDQRSSRATASEKAREKISAALEKRKMKEQAAPVETPITLPVTNSREGFRV